MVFSTQVRHRCCICYRCPTNNFLVQDCIIDYDWYEWRLITMMLVSCTYMYSINTIIIMTSSNMVDECMSVWEYENVWEIERDRTNNYISYQIIRLQGRKGPVVLRQNCSKPFDPFLFPRLYISMEFPRKRRGPHSPQPGKYVHEARQSNVLRDEEANVRRVSPFENQVWREVAVRTV